MRTIGILLLIAGFLWIAGDGFTNYQHARWAGQSQHLPAGETIPRAEAVRAMRKLSLALKDRHRLVLVPATLMLTGGLLVTFKGSTNRGGSKAR